MLKILALCAIVLLPFTNLFALGTFTTLSFLSASLFLVLFAASGHDIWIPRTAQWLLGLALITSLSTLVHLALRAEGLPRPFITDTVVFLLLAWHAVAAGNLLRYLGMPWISRALVWAVGIAALIAVVDFVLINAFGFRMDDFLYRYAYQNNAGSVLGIVRARGPFDEPSRLAFFLNAFLPLLLVFGRGITRALVGTVAIGALVLTFSAAALAIVMAVPLLLLLLPPFSVRKLAVFATAVGVVTFVLLSFPDAPLVTEMTLKLTLDPSEVSAVHRAERLAIARQLFGDILASGDAGSLIMGLGSGYLDEAIGSSLGSVYAWLPLQFGVPALATLLAAMATGLVRSRRLVHSVALQWSLLAVMLHLAFVIHFQLLFAWYPFLLVDFLVESQTVPDAPTMELLTAPQAATPATSS